MTKEINPEEQKLKDILRSNIKKYRHRRNWSQSTLAEKINISTNFLADIEAGNTWISAQTLAKLAQAFEIDAFMLFIPEKVDVDDQLNQKNAKNDVPLHQFLQDITVVLQESMEKALVHVKEQYKII